MNKKKTVGIVVASLGFAVALGIVLVLIKNYSAASADDDALAELKERKSEWFGLSTEEGLTVLVWQLEDGNIRCGLVSGNYATDGIDRERTIPQEMWQMGAYSGVTSKEMKLILSTYDIPKEKIFVTEYGSFAWSQALIPITEGQMNSLREELFGK